MQKPTVSREKPNAPMPENSLLTKDHLRVLILATLLTTGALTSIRLYKNYLQPIRHVRDIPQHFFHNRTLRGRVTRVGDGDNFHFFHIPGGIFAGWDWLRATPKANARGLKGQTLHVRLCGVDAPERAHFGKPAQPYSEEALQWLKDHLLGRKVNMKPLALDQYGRVVGKVEILTWFGWKNVSLEMIKNGIGVVYEGKTFAEFDGDEAIFRKAEMKAKKQKKGLWNTRNLVTPGEYKKIHG